MERITFRTAATLSLFILLAVSPALADSNQHINANVPFDFVAAEKTFPAGEYTLAPGGPQHTILIRSVDNKHVLFVITMDVQATRVQNDSKLIFHRYGDRYFLSEVWAAASERGILLPEPVAERVLAKASKSARTQVAVVATPDKKTGQ
jgi:hypothetical protein